MFSLIRIALVLGALGLAGSYFIAGEGSSYQKAVKRVFLQVDQTLQRAVDRLH